MGFIRSFEDSHEDSYGDLLSSGRPRTDIRVGFLPCGYFEYWRMFTSLKPAVERNLKLVEDRLRKKYDVVSVGMVDTLDSAEAASRVLDDSQIDALIIVLGTYVPDFISMHAIKRAKNAPVMILAMQESGQLSLKEDYQEGLRNSGAMGVAQLAATFRKVGRKYKVAVGALDDEGTYARVDCFLQSIRAVHAIRERNIGVVGNVFRGMYDLELSKTFLKGTFDVNVIYMQNTHLFDAWEDTSEQEATVLADRLMARFAVRSVSRTDIVRACHLAVAMRKMVERFRLDALCFLDQHYIQKLFRTTARIGASLLLEDLGIPVCCEGDIGGIVMTMLMQSLCGSNPLQVEWGEYDEPLNAMMLRGHGVGDPAMAASDECVTLTRTPEDWGMDGVGLNYEFIVKPGQFTLGHLLEVPSGYTMLISRVQCLPHPTMRYDEIHAMARVDMPIKKYLEKVFEFGVAHHCILAQGDIAERLEMVTDLLNLNKLTI